MVLSSQRKLSRLKPPCFWAPSQAVLLVLGTYFFTSTFSSKLRITGRVASTLLQLVSHDALVILRPLSTPLYDPNSPLVQSSDDPLVGLLIGFLMVVFLMVRFLMVGLLVVVVVVEVVVVEEVAEVVEMVLDVVFANDMSTMDVLILGLRLIKLGCSEVGSASAPV